MTLRVPVDVNSGNVTGWGRKIADAINQIIARFEALLALSGTFVGYTTGAGGAVTQLTNKATGVTLNRRCGQITMNNAALAAATSVGFTLTNSEIAATDTVVVNIASGATADSYSVTVDAVAAGSCRIQLRNVSAGALGEAVVLNFAAVKAVNA